MFDLVDTLKKVFSKRYFVIFFDKENLPTEGTQITVGELVADFRNPEKGEIQILQKEDKINVESVCECRKCGFREVKK